MKNKMIFKISSGVLLCTMLAYTTPVLALTKEETVYSKIDIEGNNYSTIVNNHLINENKEKIINDLSDLINIQNVNGEEKLEQTENELIWHAEGNDIYYQGETSKSLPIESKISYKLNGKEIEARELAGKSGKVEITIQYTNKDKHGELYTPFVAICATVFNNENNRNIQITNGKVIDNGNKTIVMGMAFPGMQESLNISKSKIEIPSSVKITMDAENFEQNNIITYVTPKVFEESDLEVFDELDEIYSKVNTLESSSTQLENGAKALKEGANTYEEKIGEFYNAMEQVSTGASSANKSYTKIDDGISTLNKNASSLQNGVKAVDTGVNKVIKSMETISKAVGEMQTGTKALQAGEKEISDGLDKIIAGLNGVTLTDNASKIKELQSLITANENTITTLTQTNTALKAQLSAIPANNKTTKETLSKQITANESLIKLLQTNVTANKETINTLQKTDASQMKQLQEGLKALKQGMQGEKGLQAGTKQLYDGQTKLKTQIDTFLNTQAPELSNGTKSLYQGTAKMTEGIKTLNQGSSQMKQGLTNLDNGTAKLLQASNQLSEGANSLSKGATTLSEGMTKFNKEGIKPICNYVNGDLKDITTRIEKLQKLSEEYTSFTMLNEKDKGNVKFIMITDSIKKEEE